MDTSNQQSSANILSTIGSAINTVYSARYASEISKYNQSLYNIRAGVLEANNKWKKQKFADMRKTYMAKGITTISAQNVGMGRTSLALLNKSMENLYIDEAISDYNNKMEIIGLESTSAMVGLEGESKKKAMYAQAANSVVKGVTDAVFKMYSGGA